MTATTAVTLAGGREYLVAGDYDSVDAYLEARTMTPDDGKRRVKLACGKRATIQIGAVTAVEERTTARKQAVGFR